METYQAGDKIQAMFRAEDVKGNISGVQPNTWYNATISDHDVFIIKKEDAEPSCLIDLYCLLYGCSHLNGADWIVRKIEELD